VKLSSIFNRTNLALALGLIGLIFGVKSHFDEQAIMAEMRRQVGNADIGGVGWQYNYWKEKDVPVSAWEKIATLEDRLGRLENRIRAIDETEALLLGSDTFWNMARIYFIDGDLDNDRVKNGDDECPDIPGNDDWFPGCPASTDSDGDGVANYRDACPNQVVTEGWWVHDDQVVRGPRSLFPSDQGCAFPTAEPAADVAPATPVAVDTAPPVAATAPVVPASVEVWVCDKPGVSVQFSGSSQAGWKLTCDGTVWACGNKAANQDGTVTLNKEDCTAAN
jgi:hypothetical protein